MGWGDGVWESERRSGVCVKTRNKVGSARESSVVCLTLFVLVKQIYLVKKIFVNLPGAEKRVCVCVFFTAGTWICVWQGIRYVFKTKIVSKVSCYNGFATQSPGTKKKNYNQRVRKRQPHLDFFFWRILQRNVCLSQRYERKLGSTLRSRQQDTSRYSRLSESFFLSHNLLLRLSNIGYTERFAVRRALNVTRNTFCSASFSSSLPVCFTPTLVNYSITRQANHILILRMK